MNLVQMAVASRMMRRLPHPVELFEVADVALAGEVTAERADRLAVLDRDEGVAEGVEPIADRARPMVGEGRFAAELDTIDLVAETLGVLQHRIVAAKVNVHRALVGRNAFEARDREVEAGPFPGRLGEIVEETRGEHRRGALDTGEGGIVEDKGGC